MWGYMSGWWGGAMGLFMTLFWLIVLVGVVALVWGLLRAGGSGMTANGPRPDSALHILEERYAHGEIGQGEFEQKKRDLGK